MCVFVCVCVCVCMQVIEGTEITFSVVIQLLKTTGHFLFELVVEWETGLLFGIT